MWNSDQPVKCPSCRGKIYLDAEGDTRCVDCCMKVAVKLSFIASDQNYLYVTCNEVDENRRRA